MSPSFEGTLVLEQGVIKLSKKTGFFCYLTLIKVARDFAIRMNIAFYRDRIILWYS